jgi:TonB family protein
MNRIRRIVVIRAYERPARWMQRRQHRIGFGVWLSSLAVHAALAGCALLAQPAASRKAELLEVRIAYLGEQPVPSPVSEPVAEPERERVPDAVPEPSPEPETRPEPPIEVAMHPADTPIAAWASDLEPAAVPSPPPVTRPVMGPATDAAAPAVDETELAYWHSVRSEVVRRLRYPRVHVDERIDTNVLLRITIDPRGRLVQVVTSGGDSPFSTAAKRAVEAAAPFSAPLEGVPLCVELPVRFVRAH